MDNLKYLKISAFFIFQQILSISNAQREAIAALISVSDLPAATAFSMRASEMAEFDPSAIKSVVNGTPNFDAISLTFSWEALASAETCAAL